MNTTWTFHTFDELSEEAYHRILGLRKEVFAHEAHAGFVDVDGQDEQAIHLTGTVDGELVAYSRLLPRSGNGESLLSRIAIQPEHRTAALSRELLQRSLDGMTILFEPKPIRAAAPERHRDLYEGFGFRQDGDGYLEAGVMHVSMLRYHQAR